ncbi:MAG: ribonuclease R [Rhabdochlamydiaceae bacterium]|nr:ribonuclease R [Candidatus Amphrikana amoebophyrae]
MPSKRKALNLEALTKSLKELIEGRKYTPLNFKEIVCKLKLPPKYEQLVQDAITSLISSQIIYDKKGRLYPVNAPEKNSFSTGVASVHPRGFAFVSIEGEEQDLFVPKPCTNGAVDKDIVEVEIEAKVSSKGPEGKIVNIVQRARSDVYCVVEEKFDEKSFYTFSPLLGMDKDLIVSAPKEKKLKRGDRIIAKVTEWGQSDEACFGKLKEVIGSIDKAAIDIDCAIFEHHLNDKFPKGVVAEAKKFGKAVSKKLEKGRIDLTHLETLTIDPTTAKDFDDALSIDKDKEGNFNLGVHIADVSHYVTPGSALDLEAFKRGNSTYFPGRCVPMLPEELSNELCSLKENVERFTVSILMKICPDGQILEYKITKAVIKSRKRFSYEQAKEALDGKLKTPHLPKLELLVELCHVFKKLRRARGSVDLTLPENKIEVDDLGNPIGMKTIEYDITHQLVEECMLKANELVATHLKNKQVGAIYRVHDCPGADQLKDLQSLALILGFKLPSDPTPHDLQKLFDDAKESPLVFQLSVAYIRSMKLAMYSPENIGHYGLALDYYTHFTSPIRRYSDLVIHRLLFDPKNVTDLQAVCDHCSTTERASFKAEMQVIQMKKLRLLDQMQHDNPKAIYNAVVTKVKPQGIHFELENSITDGFLHISNLKKDYFNFDFEKNRLVGSNSNYQYYVTKKIALKIVAVDLVVLEVEWKVV